MNNIKVKSEVPEPEIDVENDEIDEDEEWEEMTMVVTVNGILDADLVREAVKTENVKLRYAETENPVLQMSNSLYTATWTRDLGTNIIIESRSPDDYEVISCTSTILQAEKALLTSVKTDNPTSTLAAPADEIPKTSLSRAAFPKTKI